MSPLRRPVNRHASYHAHLYFDARTEALARGLVEQARERPGLSVGRLHRRLVGPHSAWSCQLSFDQQQFDGVIFWLEAERDGLSVLVHGVTGDDLRDHTEFAYWLGEPLPLKLSIFGAEADPGLDQHKE
ncbi:DOPA 4,5-dioxygenase family protein [Aestuariirhabdus litorea]|uniref:4,5-dioxygenase n=1 Tax=Aestuariirhabdus litorea TaxID=2528527 RepID=A0A3P3VN45_9GAMM|nr:DOPA 4,5-dioxygenase family protein [Aestuariirhabdus litorea]RRJ83767.1 4,5-dioxygenase [Aestuariirhabdus litorea]RWW96990.1 4,5-dioxygenase [Endozoicomonadaceae bacterium GTF-13]